MIPTKVFLTKGNGTHRHRLHSFELALRSAGIASCNLISVSSIIPPHCALISKKEGCSLLQPGEITYCVLSKMYAKKPANIGASIGIAIPADKNDYGYIAEYNAVDESEKQLKKKVEDHSVLMLATKKGETNVSNPKESLISKNRSIQQFKDQIKTKSIADIIHHTDPNLWSTVVAVAVFIE